MEVEKSGDKKAPDAIIEDTKNKSLEKSTHIQDKIYEKSEILGNLDVRVAKLSFILNKLIMLFKINPM